jgi:aspartate aminotransferase
MYLLETAHVSLVSGDAFGTDTCIRISFATADEKLIEAFSRMKKALDKLQ